MTSAHAGLADAALDVVDDALRTSASTFRSPRMFDAEKTDAVAGSVHCNPVKSMRNSALTLAALIGGPMNLTPGTLAETLPYRSNLVALRR